VKVHCIWTRAIDGVPMAGRPNVARQIRAAFRAEGFAVRESILRPITATGRPGNPILAALRLLLSLVALRPLPLQCLLFGGRQEALRVIREIPANCDLLYLDGVRCLRVLEQLHRLRPSLAVLTDLDDLMSRRMDLLLALGQPPSLGYLSAAVPGLFGRLLSHPILARLVLRYEATSLRRAERQVAQLSDMVVLISSADAAVLRARAPGSDVRSISIGAARIVNDPPALRAPWRFVFIGTDALRQNQLTIDALIALWRRHQIQTPLAIYGEQQRRYDLPPAVTMPGYAESLDAVYDCHSVLLTPSYVAGGIKTKVIEAFALGTPVVGNATTFEAIEIAPDYPLLFADDESLLPLLRNPAGFAATFVQAARQGLSLVREHHDPAKIQAAWADAARTAAGLRAEASA